MLYLMRKTWWPLFVRSFFVCLFFSCCFSIFFLQSINSDVLNGLSSPVIGSPEHTGVLRVHDKYLKVSVFRQVRISDTHSGQKVL